jgi:hypothetical protein
VLSRNKSPLYASLDWLKEHEAIDEDDIKSLNNIKDYRNALAHDLFERIGKDDFPEKVPMFAAMVELLHKIEVWWIVNVEIDANPDFDGIEIDESKIQPGPVMALKMMIDVALGDKATSTYYYTEFQKRTRANKSGDGQ